MRYRSNRYSNSKPTPRDMVLKFAGPCVCCGATIAAGTFATYYPAGTIASRSTGAVGHIGGLDGTSQACYVEQCKAMEAKGLPTSRKPVPDRDPGYVDPGELAADRWNETHGDRY